MKKNIEKCIISGNNIFHPRISYVLLLNITVCFLGSIYDKYIPVNSTNVFKYIKSIYLLNIL
jgi:hypothetical protein